MSYQKKMGVKLMATDIQWDIDVNDIAQDIIEGNLVYEATGKTEENIVAEARQYDKVSEEDDLVFDYVLDIICRNKISKKVADIFSIPPTTIEIPETIWVELDEDDYAEAISDYISEKKEYCHEGFVIECNMSVEELEEEIDHLENEIKKTWEDAKASELEEEKELLETALCIVEAEKERDLEEVPLEH